MEWEVVSLSDMCSKIFAGGDVPKGNFSKYKTDEYRVPIFANGEKNRGLYGYTDIEKVTVPSITVSARGTIGYSEVRREPFFPIVRLIVLSPDLDVVDLNFLKYVVQSMDFINSGSSIPQLTVPMIKDYKSVLPSIPEQKRIVAILDQAFANIELARAKTEQNLKNARELFESYLQQVFSQRGEGWAIKTVSEIAETCLGKMLDKNKNKGNPKPYLRNLNVQWFDISTSDLLEMRFEDTEYERYTIKKGDLVICEGGYPGRGAIWEQEEDIFFQKALHRIRCHNEIYNRWILYYLYLSDCNGNLKKNFTGAGIQHFTGKALKQLSLPIPKAKFAEEYVGNFDTLLAKIKCLENIYHQKLNLIDELKKSILQKAFSGELTQNNQDAA